MIYPEFLQKGVKIGVTAPSDGNSKDLDFIRLNHAVEKLSKLSYPVVETPDVRCSRNGRSADGKRRAEEFLSLIKDPGIKVLISAKGGDYLCEMLSYLDFEEIKKNPKWMQGYSDNTGFLFTITTMCDIATIYGNNFNDFGMECYHLSIINNLEILKGNLVEQESFDYYEDGFHDKITGLEGYREDREVFWEHNGHAEEIMIKGRLIGGCLDVLLNLVGTRFDCVKAFLEKYKEDGFIWYLESFDTTPEIIVRSLWQLKEAGWFSYVNGFVFGRPCMYPQDSGITYKEAVESCFKEENIPIIFDADIGHKSPQFTLINGAYADVICGHGKGRIKMHLK